MTNLTSLKRRRRNLGKTLRRMKNDRQQKRYSFQKKVAEARTLSERITAAKDKYKKRSGKK